MGVANDDGISAEWIVDESIAVCIRTKFVPPNAVDSESNRTSENEAVDWWSGGVGEIGRPGDAPIAEYC